MSLAFSIAKIKLFGSAFFFPAISNAVPWSGEVRIKSNPRVIFMILPEVIGLKLSGQLQEGITTTDLVLSITEKLRSYGVVGKIVEVFGEGIKNLSVTDRATISNMSPEFGCTDTHWPIDHKTLDYLKISNRSENLIKKGFISTNYE